MSLPASRGFFTGVEPDRYQLPHPRLGVPVILLIRRVLCRAIQILRQKGFGFAEAKEDEITAGLRGIVENDLRQTGSIAGFNRQNYDFVIRQAQFENFDGTKLSKAPDLIFRLRNDETEPRMTLSVHDALFVECKPVDKNHAAGGKYCDDGLNRFVIGDYAWAMQEGMMLAYARDGRTIAEHLIPAMNETDHRKSLDRRRSLATIQFPRQLLAPHASDCDAAEPIHVSRHRRSFIWPDGKGQATEITIYHLWHDCS